jgi:type VI secretion system protein VasJ
MLGLKRREAWQWAACGKHPVAADYFRINVNTNLQEAFAGWMDEGFFALPAELKNNRLACSWRFWAKGPGRGRLVCGLIKASSDHLGRPYPLMMMGEGRVIGWEKDWLYLADALSVLWQKLEEISAMRFEHLRELEAEMKGVHSIFVDFPSRGSQPAGEDRSNGREGVLYRRVFKDRNGWMAELDASAPLGPATLADVLRDAPAWGAAPPNALFAGGSPRRHFLLLFNRSLHAGDFVELWKAGQRQPGPDYPNTPSSFEGAG